MATKTPTPTAPAPRTRRAPRPLPPVSPEALRLIAWVTGLLHSCVTSTGAGGEAVARTAHLALAGISLALSEDPALTRGLRRQNRRDKETIDLIFALGHAVPGTLRDWAGGGERPPASGATPPTSVGGPAITSAGTKKEGTAQ